MNNKEANRLLDKQRKLAAQKRKQEKEEQRQLIIQNYKKQIKKYTEKMPHVPLNPKTKNINIDCWMSLSKSSYKITTKNYKTKKSNLSQKVIRAIKLKMHLTRKQKFILNTWFKTSTVIKNKCVEYVEDHIRRHNNMDVITRKYDYNNLNPEQQKELNKLQYGRIIKVTRNMINNLQEIKAKNEKGQRPGAIILCNEMVKFKNIIRQEAYVMTLNNYIEYCHISLDEIISNYNDNIKNIINDAVDRIDKCLINLIQTMVIDIKEFTNNAFEKSDFKFNEYQRLLDENDRDVMNYICTKNHIIINLIDNLNEMGINTKKLNKFFNNFYTNRHRNNFQELYSVRVHILNETIKEFCKDYNNSLNALREGRIKHFSLKKMRHGRPSQVLNVEKSFFDDNGFLCKNVFGHMTYEYDNQYYDLGKPHKDSKIMKKGNDYYLLTPLEYDFTSKEVKNYTNDIEETIDDIDENDNEFDVVKSLTNPIKDKRKKRKKDKKSPKKQLDKKFTGDKQSIIKIANSDRMYHTKISSVDFLCEEKKKMAFASAKINKIKMLRNKLNKYIGLDPGLRTFLYGYSNGNILKIGDNISDVIKKLLAKLKEYDNLLKTKYTKTTPMGLSHRKNGDEEVNMRNKLMDKIKRTSMKISNLVDDSHWKVIDYLVKNYDTIFMGNMSSKNIISIKNNVQLDGLTKKLASRMKFYVFRQRLEYKAKLYGCTYNLIDESYTSKICSNCGWEHENLGGNKTYKCGGCSMKTDRDCNGARGIALKGLSEKYIV